jgi:TRAP-type mannitol/chloroaromatic compound transport system substrate-binding protein
MRHCLRDEVQEQYRWRAPYSPTRGGHQKQLGELRIYSMKRRKFLGHTAVVGATAAATATVSAPAISQGIKELKFVTAFPKNFPGLGTSANRVAARIEAATDGRIKVRLFNAGELVPAFGVFDAVSQGNAEMYYAAEYYFPNKSKALNFFTAVPYGMTHLETYAWMLHGGGMELWEDIHSDFGMKPFPAPATGVQMGGWLKKKINKLDDFKGLKFRMPGLGGEVLRSLGVAVVNLPGGEIFPALQSGAIDGSEWVGPWHDLAFGFYKICKHYHWPGFHEPGTVGSYSLNRKFWDSLSKSEQAIVEAVLKAEVFEQTVEYDGQSPAALDKLVTAHGVQLHKYPDDLMTELGRISGEVINDLAAGDEVSKKVWDSYRTFRKTAVGWSKIGLQGYMNARELPFKYG